MFHCLSAVAPRNQKLALAALSGKGNESGSCRFDFSLQRIKYLGQKQAATQLRKDSYSASLPFPPPNMFWCCPIASQVRTTPPNVSSRVTAISSRNYFENQMCLLVLKQEVAPRSFLRTLLPGKCPGILPGMQTW